MKALPWPVAAYGDVWQGVPDLTCVNVAMLYAIVLAYKQGCCNSQARKAAARQLHVCARLLRALPLAAADKDT